VEIRCHPIQSKILIHEKCFFTYSSKWSIRIGLSGKLETHVYSQCKRAKTRIEVVDVSKPLIPPQNVKKEQSALMRSFSLSDFLAFGQNMRI
jgi:hypothetical protein